MYKLFLWYYLDNYSIHDLTKLVFILSYFLLKEFFILL